MNSQRHLKPVPSLPTQQLRGCLPGQDWQLDFTRKTTHKRCKYLLTLVDTLLGGPSPSRYTQKGFCATQALLQEIIPRLGLPTSLQGDSGSAFTSQITQQVFQTLDIKYKPHTAWHPQPSGEIRKGSLFSSSSSPHPFRHQGPVSWKTIFPQTGGWFDGFGMIQEHYIYCALVSIIMTSAPPQKIRH